MYARISSLYREANAKRTEISFPEFLTLLECVLEVHVSKLSLVILTSGFKATRGLFWDGSRHFERRSDDEDDDRAVTPHSKLPHHTNGRAFGLLCMIYPHTRRNFGEIVFREWSPSAPKPSRYHLATRLPLLEASSTCCDSCCHLPVKFFLSSSSRAVRNTLHDSWQHHRKLSAPCATSLLQIRCISHKISS
ncbi:hypothetical protein AVEN_83350-1 [Araneus ventricosus]|uniref:Uncharacterized protein n=1 Tax=Araneus ventricosus TaxID=182803 RepID=A0A4Y2MR32_ARAVE|nr:hypothetical protein AVEN_83350-1 [Araneus ventricosus]